MSDRSSQAADTNASVSLPARVAHDVAPAVLADCLRQLAAGARRFDLAACLDFDSSLIGVLLELLRQAGVSGVTIELTGEPPNLLKLAELYGVQNLLFQTSEST